MEQGERQEILRLEVERDAVVLEGLGFFAVGLNAELVGQGVGRQA